MALPKVNQVEYSVELPLSKIEVTYHPFTVKEQKMLLTALEEGSAEVLSRALINITEHCVTSELDVREIPGPYLEYLFLKIRVKSVCETTRVRYTCVECDAPNEVEIDLEEVTVSEGSMEKTTIALTDDVGLTLRPPSFGVVEDALKGITELSAMQLLEIIALCIESIYDPDTVHNRSDFNENELMEFLDGLSTEQFNLIAEYFTELPRLQMIKEFDCEKCGHHNSVDIQGLSNFFV